MLFVVSFACELNQLTTMEEVRRSLRLRGESPEITAEEFVQCFFCLAALEICLPNVVRLPCCKRFVHRRCQQRWEGNNPNCAHCRADLPRPVRRIELEARPDDRDILRLQNGMSPAEMRRRDEVPNSAPTFREREYIHDWILSNTFSFLTY